MDILEKYKNSLRSAWGYNDYNDWPIKYNSVMHLFCKEFAEEFLYEISRVDDNILKESIRNTMNPARIYRMINPIIYGMKRIKIPLLQQQNVVIRLLDIAQTLKYGSVFNEDGKNIILSKQEVESIQLEFIQDFSISSKIHKIIGLLWAYTESIFFRAHDITKEMHGVYPYNGEGLLVREFLNLSPTDLWSAEFLIPYKKISIYTLYGRELDLKIDAYNHFFLEKGNFVSDLLAYKIVVDGVETNIDEFCKIIPILVTSINKIKASVENMDWRERTLKYADIVWYRKKPISILSGNSGSVPEKVIRNIYTGEIDERRLSLLSSREIEFMIKTII